MAGRTHTAEEVEHRRSVLAKIIARGKWSMRAAQRLATEYDVSVSQIQADKKIVVDAVRASTVGDELENRQAVWWMQVEEVYEDAMAKDDRASALRALRLTADALGMSKRHVQHTGSVGMSVGFTEADVQRAVEELLQERAEK